MTGFQVSADTEYQHQLLDRCLNILMLIGLVLVKAVFCIPNDLLYKLE